ncbi:MAG: hypothetical protein WD960_12745, partial [Gemmatimonadota bacterium]
MFPEGYWTVEALKFATMFLVAFLTGLMVLHWNVRVNYTRKINHFVLFFVPIFLHELFEFQPSLVTTGTTGALLLASLGLYSHPFRTRIPPLATMFASLDRPEDRPYTLWWLSSQVVAGYLVIIPMVILFGRLGHGALMMIPILINAVGDGLAEPVGVRFGKHEYRVRALYGDRVYVRTLEGSACVFLTGVGVIVLFEALFTPLQFWVALLTVPIFMTLAEAFSPHTWDTPFLFLVGGLTLLGIIQL